MTNFGGANPIGGGQPGPPPGQPGPPPGFPPAGPAPTGPPAGYPPAPPTGGFGGGGFGSPPPTGAPFGGPNAWGQPGNPGGGPSFAPPPFATEPPRNRRKLVLIIGGALVIVVAIVAGFIVFAGGGSAGDTKSAGGAVRGYLNALAKGDAEKALSFAANQPPDKTFLTDEILKKQIEKMPITDVQILEEESRTVHVIANFGDVPVDEEIQVAQSADGSWRLENAAYTLSFDEYSSGGLELLKSLTLFGKPVPESGVAYLFPGAVDIASSNPNLTVTNSKDSHLLSVFTYSGPEKRADVKVEVSEEGAEAANEAIESFFAECAKSTSLSPPNCPMDYGNRPDLVDGTARWTAPTDIDDLKIESGTELSDFSGRLNVIGVVKFTLSAQGVNPRLNLDNYDASAFVDGVMDMSKTPPVFTLEKE